MNQLQGGVKTGDAWEKTPDPRKQNLACLTWPELGLNPQWWDDERFRALKISILNHLGAGGTWKCFNLLLCTLEDHQKQDWKAFVVL